MKPYSKDLRIRVLAALDGGTPRAEVAETFSVSASSIKRWLKRRRQTGDIAPKPIPGRTSIKGAALEEWLPEHLKGNPDFTLEEHCKAFEEETHTKVSDATMSRAIARVPGEWPLKKSPR
jgi:transposase